MRVSGRRRLLREVYEPPASASRRASRRWELVTPRVSAVVCLPVPVASVPVVVAAAVSVPVAAASVPVAAASVPVVPCVAPESSVSTRGGVRATSRGVSPIFKHQRNVR